MRGQLNLETSTAWFEEAIVWPSLKGRSSEESANECIYCWGNEHAPSHIK